MREEHIPHSILMGICKSNDTQDSEIWQDSDDSRDNLWFIKYITALWEAEDHLAGRERSRKDLSEE